MRKVLFFFCFVSSSFLFCHAQDADKRRSEVAAHLDAAHKFLSEKQPVKAIPELQAVAALDPTNLEVRANLGVLLYFQARFQDAVPELKAALQLKPDLWKIQSLLGIAERRVGSEGAGRSDLEAAFPHLDTDPKLEITVGRELVESYASEDELGKAAQTIETILKLEPTNPALLYISYRIHSDMATAAMLELGLAAPDSAQTHQAMAHEMQRDHDLPGTIANLRKAMALDPTLPGIHFELAEALHASDDLALRSQAEAEYKIAIYNDPNDVKALTRMGDIQVEKGNLDGGAGFYQRALKLQPTAADALIGLANVLSEKGEPAQALPLLLQVEAADPTNSLAHFRLSTTYRKLKQPEDVKRELELYQRYKDEREKLKAIYKQMRVLTPQTDPEK